jgi:hypothetical protein
MTEQNTAAPANEGNAAPAAPAAPAYDVYPPDEAPAPAPSAPAEPAPEAATGETPENDPADDAGAEGETQGEKPRGGFQKRISDLVQKQRAAEREAQYWREQATRGQQPAQQPQQQPAGTPPAAPQLPPDLAQYVGAEPKASDFPAGEFDPAFIRAATKYDMKLDQAQQALSQRQQQAQRAGVQFGQKVASIMEATVTAAPDVAEVLSDPSFPMPQHVVREVVECESPEKVLAHLAKNPTEAARIAALRTPQAVARELGKLEAKLATPAAPPTPSNAPPPPRPVRGAGSAAPRSVYDLGDDVSPAEYRRLRGYK